MSTAPFLRKLLLLSDFAAILVRTSATLVDPSLDPRQMGIHDPARGLFSLGILRVNRTPLAVLSQLAYTPFSLLW